ncbi:hypothetical protein [Haladaptatus cibarius]|uniref:hypothetical protein n=1 Tax=Haladaptatus cibarius TaxID=453847 RepID=UPI000B2A47E5|nr:hypothetical protein [Haladaptatus cibarius]
MSNSEDEFEYLFTEDMLTIHEIIAESNDDTEPGVSTPAMSNMQWTIFERDTSAKCRRRFTRKHFN